MRKYLARLRKLVAARGIELRPLTDPSSGGYGGFAVAWTRPGDAVLRGGIANVSYGGQSVKFFVDDERDLIQKEQIQGRFYEIDELQIISRYYKGGTFVDIGANVGNHSVFVGRILEAEHIIAFEPNPRAYRLLETNLALNSLTQRATVYPVGLSDRVATSPMSELAENNLGSARIDPGGRGNQIELSTGDLILRGVRLDFVKIDVEGHELSALQGLAESLRKWSPVIFIEIEDATRDAVFDFLADLDYVPEERFARYAGRENIVFIARN